MEATYTIAPGEEMDYSPSDHLWTPQRRSVLAVIEAFQRVNRVCLQSPTGSGKTQMAVELFRWCDLQDWQGSFYINRTLLIPQTSERFERYGLRHGIRAANWEDQFLPFRPFQICSSDTENSRVYKKKQWELHDANLIIVDEAHLQKTGVMEKIIQDHLSLPGERKVLLLTATPVGMSDWADELIVSGTMAEYRECKAIVPARCFSVAAPDLRKVKRNITGEYIMDGQKKKIYTQSIIGGVIDYWKKLNPDARPTMLYAPGVDESVWIAEQFQRIGVRFAHVDATDAIIDGKRAKLTRPLWQEIQERYKSGDIQGICSRFRMREGVDLPSTFCCVLATPIGSLASYIQTVGRVIRYSEETPDDVMVIDHGGNYLRHGSPNDDRPWEDWWRMPPGAISEAHTNKIRDGKTPEPICCPVCHMERKGGIKCPGCGHEAKKGTRTVVMEDGTLKEYHGQCVKRRLVRQQPNTESLWERMFWGWRKKGVNKSFAQMYGWFAHEHGYSPPRDLPFMPKRDEHWYLFPKQIEFEAMHEKKS
jgi:DNA repair protein RadD